MANEYLGLSLFIMLLSFFLILNSISSFQMSKSQPILNSLSITFSAAPEEKIENSDDNQTNSKSLQKGTTLDQISGLLNGQITGVESRQNRLGTMMFVKMPFKEFQRSMQASLIIPDEDTPDRTLSETEPKDFLPLLVSLIETEKNMPLRMDMILNVSENPSVMRAQTPERFAALNRAVTEISGLLEQAGMPPKQMSAGIGQGEEGMIELLFRRHEPFHIPDNVEVFSEGAVNPETDKAPSAAPVQEAP